MLPVKRIALGVGQLLSIHGKADCGKSELESQAIYSVYIGKRVELKSILSALCVLYKALHNAL